MSGSACIDHADPLDAAVAWFSRYRSGRMTASERALFNDWIAQSPDNQEAWRQINETWSSIEPLREHPAIAEFGDDARHRHMPLHRWLVAVAACLAFMLAGTGLWFGISNNIAHDGPQLASRADIVPVHFATPVGKRSKIALSDGSLITLDTDSAIDARIDKGRRLVRLLRGRAYFHVAKDRRRPFIVQSGFGQVTALGTEFTVALRPDSFVVALLEGSVKVAKVDPARGRAKATKSVILQPGQRLSASGQIWRLARFNTSNELAWIHGQLVFEDTPLRMVVEEVNRYSNQKILIADTVVGDKRLSAILDAGDMATLLSAVEMLGFGHAQKRPDGSVVISSR